MSPTTRRVFVTDFDGTVTRNDFYNIFLNRHFPADGPDYWAMCVAGQITHFECLKQFYAAAAPGEAALRRIVRELDAPTDMAERVAALRANGWEVVIASAGCRWYIELLLESLAVSVPLHANKGRIVAGRLQMEHDHESPFFHAELGIDKAAVVRSFQERGYEVAYAGDGLADFAAACRVKPEWRFARTGLAEKLRQHREPYRHFEGWEEVATALLKVGDISNLHR